MPLKSSTLKISRSGLKLFLECPRCFWLDIHHKIKRPPGYPYTLSSAVDYLVKKEFDGYRKKGILPPILKKYGISEAKLYDGDNLEEWRNNFKGIAYFDEDLNAILYGAVDDILEYDDGSLAVIDCKSSGSREITIYEDYQKQMDTYNYILQQKGYETYPEAFFVFYQVQKEGEEAFNNVLKFRDEVKPVRVNKEWVGGAFERAVETARSNEIPSGGSTGLVLNKVEGLTPGGSATSMAYREAGHCSHCKYVDSASQF